VVSRDQVAEGTHHVDVVAPDEARVLDTAPMTLDEIVREMRTAHAAGNDVARVHSGDPSLYGAIGEQMRRLAALGIPYDVTPGAASYTHLTLPTT